MDRDVGFRIDFMAALSFEQEFRTLVFGSCVMRLGVAEFERLFV